MPPPVTPAEFWQYGAVLLVVFFVVTMTLLLKKAGEAMIAAFTAIAERMQTHETNDVERHGELVEKLGDIRTRQDSKA